MTAFHYALAVLFTFSLPVFLACIAEGRAAIRDQVRNK